MNRRNTPRVVEVYCDGPERHLNVIDRYRAKSMAGECCQVDPKCLGRIRLDRPIAEPVEETVPRIRWVIGSIALVVVTALWICLFLAYGTDWNLGRDRVRDDSAQAKSSDEGARDLATETERSSVPIDPGADKGANAEPSAGEVEVSEPAPTASSSTTEKRALMWPLQPIPPERIVPFLKRVPIDPRGALVLLAIGVLFVRSRAAHATFGILSATMFMVFGALLGEEGALWGVVIGFLIGTIDAWRITGPPRRPKT